MPKIAVGEAEKRKFVYRSFSDRVSSIKIDPIRVKGKRWEQADGETSYFITAFEHWRELNLSKNFTDFSIKCYNLCKSLPMILVNQEQIADLLFEHMAAADKMSLEAMADLVTKFARDLGQDFEPFFGRAMTTCIGLIAAQKDQPDLEVVEQTFYCLAYLFKYLARLLTTDLRPTFDFLAPLFGKTKKQPGYVLRFAAESLSFLIRKCSPEALDEFLEHVFEQLAANPNEHFLKSLSTLLANTLKSTGNNLHSKAEVLLAAMIKSVESRADSTIVTTLLGDVFVDVLHHLRQDVAAPFYGYATATLGTTALNYKLLFILGCLRKGDRVSDWGALYEVLVRTEAPTDTDDAIVCAAGLFSTSDFGATTKYFKHVIAKFDSEPLLRVYELVRQQNSQVFNTFVVGVGLGGVSSAPVESVALFNSRSNASIKAKLDLHKFRGNDEDLFRLWWQWTAFGSGAKPTSKLFGAIVEFTPSAEYEVVKSELLSHLVEAATPAQLEALYSCTNLTSRLLDALAKVAQSSEQHATLVARLCSSADDAQRHSAVDLVHKLAPRDLLNDCSIVDDISRDLSNARNIQLRVRNLVTAYAASGKDAVLDAAVPRFVFGLLASKFQPIWKVALECIPEIFKKQEHLAWSLVTEWLNRQPAARLETFQEEAKVGHVYACTNLEALQKSVSQVSAEFGEPLATLRSSLAGLTAADLEYKQLALRALNEVPRVAEAHASELVALFLERLPFPERLQFLELFSKFRKPCKMERFNEVRDLYLQFLTSKHAPLVKCALACLLTLNNAEGETLRKYRESMETLLDAKRFRDEVSVLFTTDKGSVHETDRALVIPVACRILFGYARKTNRPAVLSVVNSYFSDEHQRFFIGVVLENLRFEETRRLQATLGLLYDYTKETRVKVRPVFDLIVPALIETFKLQPSRPMRQAAAKCLDLLLTVLPERELWNAYYEDIYREFLAPRLAAGSVEQVSTMMSVVLTMSSELELVQYLGLHNGDIVAWLFGALRDPATKEAVIKHVFTVGRNLFEHGVLVSEITGPVVAAVPGLLQKVSPSTTELMVSLLNSLPVEEPEAIVQAELAIFRENATVTPGLKVALLESLERLLPQCSAETVERAFKDMARLFKQFGDPRARQRLAGVYAAFKAPGFERTGRLVVELNSYEQKRLGLPDFERRLAAFGELNESIYGDLKPHEWLVLLYNCLFFIKDPEELSLRNNGVYLLKRFVQSMTEELLPLHLEVLSPAIKMGMREQNDVFRELYVAVLAELSTCSLVPEHALAPLMEADVEANFFYNIFHIQIHRRQKAVQRLAAKASAGELESTALSQYMIPLVEHLALPSSKKHQEINSLANEAVQAVTALAQKLTFNQYRALTRRYLSTLTNNPSAIKRNTKLLNAAAHAIDAHSGDKGLHEFALSVAEPVHKLMAQKTSEEILNERVALAVPLTLFLRALPEDQLVLELPGKLTFICQLLRAKSQELRDLVRSTLSKMATLLGPSYLHFIVSELKSALTRGPQLHVLGYTVHQLLATLKAPLGSIDASVPLVAEIIMEDIFGSTGQDKDNENYITGAKEVKTNKSYDSGLLLAEIVSIEQFGLLVAPVKRFLLSKKLSLKTSRKVQDLLHRFVNGLRRNEGAQTQSGLIAFYQLDKSLDLEGPKVEDAPKLSGAAQAREDALEASRDFHTVKLKMAHKLEDDRVFYANLHLLKGFVLEAMRIVLVSDLLNASNVKGLLPLMEAALEDSNENVQVSALKLAAFCLKVPLNCTDKLLHIGRRALQLIKTTSTTSSELCQACLKLLTVLLKACPEFRIKDSAYAYILDRTKSDVEEPERQATTIGFVRALLAQKVMIPELYDVMDKISHVMITNGDAAVRTACRAAYLRFLLDYPHGQKRLDSYFAFLVKNLDYPTFTGRLSVLEMIRMVTQKVHEDQTDHALTSFFVGLVLVLVNDSEKQCKDAAESLLKEIVERSDQQQIVDFVSSWLDSEELLLPALHAAPLLRDAGYLGKHAKLAAKLDKACDAILEASQKGGESEWQLVYLGLQFKSTSAPDEILASTLLYPHPWVRAMSARIFGLKFAALKRDNKPLADVEETTRRFIRQLGAPLISEDHGTQVVKNLVYIIQNAAGAIIKERPLVEYTVHKLSVSLRTDINDDDYHNGKMAIVQLFAAMAQVAEPSTIPCGDIINALYLVSDQATWQPLRDLALEALEVYNQRLGTTEYLVLYNAAREHVNERRRERKTKRVMEAVQNPELHARKKLKRIAKQHGARKRKAGDRFRERA